MIFFKNILLYIKSRMYRDFNQATDKVFTENKMK